MGQPPEAVLVPLRYPTTTIFVDESGSKASASQFFAVAAVKLRTPGLLARGIQDIRDRRDFRGEFKFAQITSGALPAYFDLVNELAASNAHVAACVVQGSIYNPFKGRKPAWKAHAEVLAQLLVGCLNRRELVAVLMDGISTPRGCALDDTVRSMVNRRLQNTSIVSAICLDSRTCDLLQVADLVASAVLFERRRANGFRNRPDSPKGRVAGYLASSFSAPGFPDGRVERVNIATYRGGGPPKRDRRRARRVEAETSRGYVNRDAAGATGS